MGALVIKVRHAQDVELDKFEGDWDWAVAMIRVRSLTHFEAAGDFPLYDGSLQRPGGRLAIGDADSELLLNDLDEQTQCACSQSVTPRMVRPTFGLSWRRQRPSRCTPRLDRRYVRHRSLRAKDAELLRDETPEERDGFARGAHDHVVVPRHTAVGDPHLT